VVTIRVRDLKKKSCFCEPGVKYIVGLIAYNKITLLTGR
jgi:hypothetical protein